MTSASASDLDTQLFDYLKMGARAGLRFVMKNETRTNISFDYGKGADRKGAFYFGLNAYFNALSTAALSLSVPRKQ